MQSVLSELPQTRRATGRGKRRQYLAGEHLPYACSEASSDGSSWMKEYEDPAMSCGGRLSNDISYSHPTAPGVCVYRQMRMPDVPPPARSSTNLREIERALRNTQAADTAAQAAFAARGSALLRGSEHGASSEILPKHQRLTAGKPSICRSLPESIESLAKILHADDSCFTSEYRSHLWWKTVPQSQKHELKEHVRPFDNWTLFRDQAVKQKAAMRQPMNTY